MKFEPLPECPVSSDDPEVGVVNYVLEGGKRMIKIDLGEGRMKVGISEEQLIKEICRRKNGLTAEDIEKETQQFRKDAEEGRHSANFLMEMYRSYMRQCMVLLKQHRVPMVKPLNEYLVGLSTSAINAANGCGEALEKDLKIETEHKFQAAMEEYPEEELEDEPMQDSDDDSE